MFVCFACFPTVFTYFLVLVRRVGIQNGSWSIEDLYICIAMDQGSHVEGFSLGLDRSRMDCYPCTLFGFFSISCSQPFSYQFSAGLAVSQLICGFAYVECPPCYPFSVPVLHTFCYQFPVFLPSPFVWESLQLCLSFSVSINDEVFPFYLYCSGLEFLVFLGLFDELYEC